MPIPNIIADFRTTLALKVAVGATTATLTSITDEDGDVLPNGTYGFTIDRKNSNKEYIECTLTSTSLSAIKTIDRGTGVATSGFALAHRKGAEVIISDFVVIKRLQDIFETGYPEAYTPSTDYQLASKKYVDDIALGGSTTVDRVTVVATCGEDVSAGELLYLKVSDSKWWKTDADTVATVDNVVLGIAQGAGTANDVITGGVLIKGVDPNQSGLTPNSIYYASNTAGAISATSGTITRVVGIATAADKLYFDPDFNKTYKNYAVDSVGTDSYAITLQSAFGALYDGMEVTFKAGTANTGACTLAVNGLTAKTIKKDVSVDLVTGDILANQIVKVVYDGTNFQLISKTPSSLPIMNVYTSDGTWTKPAGLKYIVVEVVGGGGGGGGTTNNNGWGGGGGGGGYSKEILAASVLGATEEYDVGAGGSAGAGSSESAGGAGGTSNFGTTPFLQATGGAGGGGRASPTGGDGGVGSNGTLNISGSDGGTGTSDSTDDRSLSGFGGNSFYGGGARNVVSSGSSDVSGIAGNAYGGGGSGAVNGSNGTDVDGGAGAAGVVIVTEYF